MAKIIPFKAFRPTRDKAHLAASRSYISYSKKALLQKLSKNPFSFLHVINPEYKNQDISLFNSIPGLTKIKNKFFSFHEDNIYLQDENPCLYIYRQIKDENEYTGIIGCISIDDYH